ncbi:MAG: M48 family metalloprotease [Planctomycetota bacterium]
MSYVLPIFVALFSLAIPDLGWEGGQGLPWLLPLVGAVPYAIAWRMRERLVRGRYRAAARADRVLDWAPVLLQGIAVGGLGWSRAVERWWGIETSLLQWPGLGLAVGILPFLVAQAAAIDARARAAGGRAGPRRELRSFQGRMLLSALLPFLLFVGISSLVAIDESWRVRIEEIALYNTLFVGGLIAVFVLVLPFLLERTWETAPLEAGRIRGVLDEVARRAGFRCRELLVWKTGHCMANAAIVGFTPGSRVVLFSDALLAQLGPRELAAVYGHEIGHARGHHPAIFAGYALLLFLAADVLLTQLSLASEAAEVGVFLGVLAAWLALFGYASRRFELEADLASVELLGDERPLVDALAAVGGSSAASKGAWRHFGMARRMEFLARAARDPAVGRRLRRVLLRFKLAGLSTLLVAGALHAGALARAFGPDQVVADLRLGEFERPAERLAAGVEVEARLARLVERAASLGPGRWGASDLEEEARAACAAGDLRAGAELLDLAALRGGERELEALAAAIQAAAGGPEDLPRPLTAAELELLPAPWPELLAPPVRPPGARLPRRRPPPRRLRTRPPPSTHPGGDVPRRRWLPGKTRTTGRRRPGGSGAGPTAGWNPPGPGPIMAPAAASPRLPPPGGTRAEGPRSPGERRPPRRRGSSAGADGKPIGRAPLPTPGSRPPRLPAERRRERPGRSPRRSPGPGVLGATRPRLRSRTSLRR